MTVAFSYSGTNIPGGGGNPAIAKTVTAGDTIGGSVCYDGAGSLTSVTGVIGNTYSVVDTVTDTTNNQKVSSYDGACPNGGAETVTATIATSSANTGIFLHGVTGCDTTTPLHKHAINFQASPGTAADNVTSGSQTTTVNGCYIGGFMWSTSGNDETITKGTGSWVQREAPAITNFLKGMTEDQVQASAGAIAATFQTSLNNAQITAMLIFAPSSGGGGGGGGPAWGSRLRRSPFVHPARKGPPGLALRLKSRRSQIAVAGPITNTITLAPTQTATSLLIRSSNAIRSVTQASSAALVRTTNAVRVATQTATAAISRAVAVVRSATQAATATLATIKVKLLTLTATQTATATMARLVGAVRSATQTASATLTRAVGVIRLATQAATSVLVKQAQIIRSATQASTSTLASIKVKLLTLTATQTATATMARLIGAVRNAAQSSSAVLARFIAAVRAATQTGSAIVGKLISVTRSGVQSAIASLGRSTSAGSAFVYGNKQVFRVTPRLRVWHLDDRNLQ